LMLWPLRPMTIPGFAA